MNPLINKKGQTTAEADGNCVSFEDISETKILDKLTVWADDGPNETLWDQKLHGCIPDRDNESPNNEMCRIFDICRQDLLQDLLPVFMFLPYKIHSGSCSCSRHIWPISGVNVLTITFYCIGYLFPHPNSVTLKVFNILKTETDKHNCFIV